MARQVWQQHYMRRHNRDTWTTWGITGAYPKDVTDTRTSELGKERIRATVQEYTKDMNQDKSSKD